MHRDRIVRSDRLLVPDRGIDLVDGEDLSRIFYEEEENIVLDRRELYRLSLHRHLLGVVVDDETAARIDAVQVPGLADIPKLGVAPELGLYAGHHLEGIEGLCDIVIRADVQPQDLVVVLALCGEDNDGDGAFLADLERGADPIQTRHHDIDNQEVHLLLIHNL